MSFSTASAILRGKWLIEPTYAKAQLPLVMQMIKRMAAVDQSAAYRDRLEYKPKTGLGRKFNYAGVSSSDVYSCNPYTSTDRLPYNSIAMIDILGPILKYGDFCTYGTVEYNDLMIRLANSERVKGILLNIDSGGGMVDGTGLFSDTIREVIKVKPVLSVIQDGMAGSAAEWIASSTQETYVTRSTCQVGSIGAYCTIYDFAGWFEDNGIKVHEIYAPQSIDKNKDYKDAIKGDYSLIESELKFTVEDFVSAVKKGRGARLKSAGDEPFTGKMYYGAQALKLGLIDGIKPFAGVIKRMEELIALRA